ncbi:hypothetical protein MPH_12421 [Macrophomina phaseolina MS6]|uniref:Scytalone dehydratase-like protein Arp1 N-terminal domain-containing protein n=1 Tax=Macrophomina phaseolina (strain MS6) TaxID=1126212 RepID=K2R889_MACPH|nr:hypothetical protein MPH_12421 [Macrophomina phaseolina MS6]
MVLYALCFLVYTSPVAFATKIIRQACLDSICYFIPSDHVLKLDSALNISSAEDDEPLPISVVNLDLPNIGNEDILSALGHFNAIDGVWSPTFAAYIYIQRNAKWTQRASKGCLSDLLFDVGTVLDTSSVQEAPLLPEGPYFLDAHTKKPFKAYRLYDDIQQTFLQASHCANQFTIPKLLVS